MSDPQQIGLSIANRRGQVSLVALGIEHRLAQMGAAQPALEIRVTRPLRPPPLRINRRHDLPLGISDPDLQKVGGVFLQGVLPESAATARSKVARRPDQFGKDPGVLAVAFDWSRAEHFRADGGRTSATSRSRSAIVTRRRCSICRWMIRRATRSLMVVSTMTVTTTVANTNRACRTKREVCERLAVSGSGSSCVGLEGAGQGGATPHE